MNSFTFPLDNGRKNFYVNAAEYYIEQSKIFPEHETALLERAETLVLKAKALEKQQQVRDLKKKFSDFILAKKPERTFKDIGGLEKVKENISLKIIEPFRNPEIFHHFGKKIGGGILMYGPPGCGKSLIAEATAGECHATFFNVKASDLKSKYVGETEKNIAKLFKEAREQQPSIIFFDEFEAVGAERSAASPYDKSMVSQLLAETDGLGNKDQQILLIAASNEPWNIDLALRREGRFGTGVFVPPPDLKARIAILKILLKEKPLHPEINIETLALLTNEYSGAELEEICNAAIEEAIKDCLKNKKLRTLTLEDFKKVLQKKISTTALWFKKAMKSINISSEQDYFKELLDFEEQITA